MVEIKEYILDNKVGEDGYRSIIQELYKNHPKFKKVKAFILFSFNPNTRPTFKRYSWAGSSIVMMKVKRKQGLSTTTRILTLTLTLRKTITNCNSIRNSKRYLTR